MPYNKVISNRFLTAGSYALDLLTDINISLVSTRIICMNFFSVYQSFVIVVCYRWVITASNCLTLRKLLSRQ